MWGALSFTFCWPSVFHDDVAKWKRLLPCWIFVKGIRPMDSLRQRPVIRCFDILFVVILDQTFGAIRSCKPMIGLSSAKWRPFCPGGDELSHAVHIWFFSCDMKTIFKTRFRKDVTKQRHLHQPIAKDKGVPSWGYKRHYFVSIHTVDLKLLLMKGMDE